MTDQYQPPNPLGTRDGFAQQSSTNPRTHAQDYWKQVNQQKDEYYTKLTSFLCLVFGVHFIFLYFLINHSRLFVLQEQ